MQSDKHEDAEPEAIEEVEPDQNDKMNQKMLASLLERFKTGQLGGEFAKLFAPGYQSDSQSSSDDDDDVVRIPFRVPVRTEFRIVETPAGIRPSPLHTSRLPRDVLEITSAEDIKKLAELVEQSHAGTLSDGDEEHDE